MMFLSIRTHRFARNTAKTVKMKKSCRHLTDDDRTFSLRRKILISETLSDAEQKLFFTRKPQKYSLTKKCGEISI